MILVDRELEKRRQQGKPVRVGLVGAGYSGRHVAHQILTSFPALKLVVIANRTIAKAEKSFADAGILDVRLVDSKSHLENAIAADQYVVTEDSSAVCEAEQVEVVIETTGTIEHGARVVLDAIGNGKHVILLNAELDATLGPILKYYADRAGVIYSNTDGDEPGVAMNMYRFVSTIGLTPVVAGNLKGLYDRYRTPETQREFAAKHNQKPTAMTSFVDGTKLSMELTVLANATGFRVGKRGMYGPRLAHVRETTRFYLDKLLEGGMVDFLEGAEPGNGAYVVAYTADPVKMDYLRYLKMGDGPLYVFYTPFHLPQLEIPITVARAVLFGDATVAPLAGPVCDAIAVAKRDLEAGEILDGIGGFTCYSLVDNENVSRAQRTLPMGVSSGCTLKRCVRKDQALTYDDVALPEGRLCDQLREEQRARFNTRAAP